MPNKKRSIVTFYHTEVVAIPGGYEVQLRYKCFLKSRSVEFVLEEERVFDGGKRVDCMVPGYRDAMACYDWKGLCSRMKKTFKSEFVC
jgi:hypothetical protein